jgi:hypothetical protein
MIKLNKKKQRKKEKQRKKKTPMSGKGGESYL